MSERNRFDTWAGQGLPRGWALAMGWKDHDGDGVWPIVDNTTSGPIDGRPKPEQMLCWCPSSEKQAIVAELLRAGTQLADARRIISELEAAQGIAVHELNRQRELAAARLRTIKGLNAKLKKAGIAT